MIIAFFFKIGYTYIEFNRKNMYYISVILTFSQKNSIMRKDECYNECFGFKK